MSKAKLGFKRLEKIWRTTGILTDARGNTFRVFVSGTSERDVSRFVAYQKKKKGIHVKVTTLRKRTGKKAVAAETEPGDGTTLPLTPVKVGGVQVGISRLKMVTRPPYKITYTIDPPAPSTPPFVAEFSLDKPSVKVVCTATRGAVKTELFELDNNNNAIRRDSKTVKVNLDDPNLGDVKAGEESLIGDRGATGTWQVKVTADSPSSYFKLSWDKVVN
jgi:hypothetical protein